jgi:amidase
MKRVLLLVSLMAPAVSGLAGTDGRGHGKRPDRPPTFQLVEATIPEIQHALETHRINSKQLVKMYLDRIAAYEGTLNGVIALNPDAVKEAHRLDVERARGRVRGPLHGIPIALKDNIHTTNMPTTGGALAFDDFTPPYEATLVKSLRDAGAVILAKTVLTELANWVAGAPTPMPANYSAVGGFGMNPYDPRPDPRPGFDDGRPALATGGSSSGIGTAANFWVANVGTETSGSILSPANQNMLAAIKPTVGLISRHGVIPITADQDTAGPMARTVTDAAILLGAMTGVDPNDPATSNCPAIRDYRPFLDPDALSGARIGIPRAFYYEPVVPPGGSSPAGGLTAEQAAVMSEAIEILEQQGAIIVDPADLPSVVDSDPGENLLLWGICAGADQAKGSDSACSVVLKFGFKRDFNLWLESLGPDRPVGTLTDLRNFNLAHVADNAIKYGQSRLDISDEMDPTDPVDVARYMADRDKDLFLTAEHGIDEVMIAENLDALLFPDTRGADVAARPGYPTVIVPFGTVPNAPTPPFPPGFDAEPAPFGVAFTGTACSEGRLIELAYAFEQATLRRVSPASAPPLKKDHRGRPHR